MKYTKNKKMIITSIFSTICIIIVYFIRIPILPSFNFLEYEFSDSAIILLTHNIGIIYGLIATFITSMIQGLTISANSGIIGIIMNIVSTSSYIIIFYLFSKKFNLYIAIIFSSCIMTLIMSTLNYNITPIIYGLNQKTTINLIIFGIIPFNLIKSISNSLLFLFLNKYIKFK